MPDNADLLNFFQGVQTQTRARVQQGLEANPDDAARAIDLSETTGVPPSVVNGDLEGFDKRFQGELARNLVLGNPQLRDYVQAHPLAASISNDDWGNLDRISKSASWLGQLSKALGASWQQGVGEAEIRGFKEGFGEGPIFPVTREGLAQQYPALSPDRGPFGGVASTLATGGLNMGDLLLRGTSGIFDAITSGIGAMVSTIGGKAAGREAKALTEYEIIKPEAGAPTALPGATEALPEGAVVQQEGTFGYPQEHVEIPGAPWVKAGKEPPAGLNHDIDQNKAIINSKAVEELDNVVKEAQASTTKERDPAFLQKWFFDRNPDLRGQSIGINGDAVVALYGNKPPTPDDGLLGWLPGIADKLELARKTGADVDVPISSWISHVDPAVAKQLHDYIRMWDGGITADEARRPGPEAKPDSDLGQVREAAGLNPVPLAPEAVGLDARAFAKIQADLLKRQQEDLEATQKFAEKEQAKRQSQEWKDNAKDMSEQVEADFRRRPDVLADLLIGNGEVNGEKVRQRFTLRQGDLTAEQEASLPKHYVSPNGLPIDDVARMVGFQSGDEMVEALANYRAQAANLSPRDALKNLIAAETNNRMEAKYGQLTTNILKAAQDQAFSENDLNLLIDEYLGAALRAGVTTVDKDAVRAEALGDIGKMKLASAKSFTYEREVAKQYRLAVDALAKENPADALQALQRRVYNAFIVAELKKVEKAKAQFDKLTSTLSSLPRKTGDNPTLGRDPDYLNYMHQIMLQVGQRVSKRSIQGIQADIDARGTGTLQQFVQTKAGAARVMPVWEQLFDPTWRKDLGDLSVDDFRALNDTLKSMDFNARDERKIEVAGEKQDLATFKGELKEELQRFPKISYTASGDRQGPLAGAMKVPRGFFASLVQMETLFNYWDKFNKWGPWNQGVMRGLVDGANQADRWKKEYTKKLGELDDGIDLKKEVANPIFRNPLDERTLGELLPFTRENLRAVMLKAGNSAGPKSNLVKLAKGYQLKPQEVMDWIHQHATKEDWDWVQGVWDLWAEIKDKSDTMFRSLSGGIAPDMVRLTPIETKFGTYKGGYFPANDWHPIFRSPRIGGDDSLFHPGFTSATATPSWAITRTGYSAPQRLDLSNMANLLGQHLHDTAMRPGIINASKIMMDKGIQNAVKLHAGDQYAGLFKPYLEALANRTNYASLHPWYANNLWIEKLRQNLVTTLVGFNLSTVVKHFFTAGIMSTKEEGDYFLRAVRMLYSMDTETREANHKFLRDNFLELDRRSRNWRETLYGEIESQKGTATYETLRQEVARYSSMPVAFSDMLTAKPTALAGYLRAIDQGMSHGDAIYAGERAVRRAHGSTAITNRPQIMRDRNPWFTSIYNFFNDIFNRQLETVWRAGEMVRDAKAGDKEAAWKHVPEIAGGLFAFAIWPAIVEQVVQSAFSPQKPDPKESLIAKMVKPILHMESSTLPFVRDFANFLVEGGEPSIGLIGTGMKEVANSYDDFFKKQPLSPQHAERMVHDWAGLFGMITGLMPQAVGNAAEFSYGVHTGIERPKGPWGWLTGLKKGTLKGQPSTLEHWWEGKRF